MIRAFTKLAVTVFSFGRLGDFGLLRKMAKRFPAFTWIYRWYMEAHGADIPLSCVLPDSCLFPHGIYGCFFSTKAVIGENCTILHHVTIGSNFDRKFVDGGVDWKAPVVGGGVFIGAGAKIIGGITIGDNAKIGAGCVVWQDVPAGATCVCGANRIILK